MAKKTLEDEINAFLNEWSTEEMIEFLKDTIPLFELYDVDENNDWVGDIVGKDEKHAIRIIRTVYLISKIADSHAGKLATCKVKYNKLWKRMESLVNEDDSNN